MRTRPEWLKTMSTHYIPKPIYLIRMKHQKIIMSMMITMLITAIITKQQLAELIKDLAKDENFKKVDNILREIKPLYDDMREKERADALTKFVEHGGYCRRF